MSNYSILDGHTGGGGSGGGGLIDRLQPQSVPDHAQYQDWNSVGSSFMPGSPMAIERPESRATTAAPT